MRRAVMLSAIWCALTMVAKADQVTLKNGDRITGTIAKSDAKTMVVKTDWAGELNVDWASVAAISSSEPLHSRTSLDERFSVFPNMSDVGQYRFQLDSTAATKLKTWLSWQITFSDRYLSNPLPGLKTNDSLLSTGLRLTFGQGKL